jgi:hypothetical protein
MTPYPTALERFPSLRQSDLATFDRCALSFYLDKTLRDGWSSDRAASGHIFHRFAAKALYSMHDQGEPTIPADVATSIFLETLRQHDIDRTCEHICDDGKDCGAPITRRYMEPPTAIEAMRGVEVGCPRVECERGHDHRSEFVNINVQQAKDLAWIVRKWSKDLAFDVENLVSIEERLRMVVRYPDPEGGFVERVISGKLDALFVAGDDDEMVVLDWKDSWAIPAPTELNFDGYFQQRIYAALVLSQPAYRDIQRVTLREVFVRKSEIREATVWRSDLEDILGWLAALVERFDRTIHEAVFPPSPGAHCLFCPKPAACPILPDVRREGSLSDDDTARRWAREAIVAESALKQRKEGLEARSRVLGPTEVSTHKGRRGWFHQDRVRTTRPSKRQIAQAIALYGREVELDRYYHTEAYSSFGLHEIPPGPRDDALDKHLDEALEASAARIRDEQ